MIITGVDKNHEDLVVWWYEQVRKHNPNAKIGIWDFGMSFVMREVVKGLDAWLSDPITHSSNIGWFNKKDALKKLRDYEIERYKMIEYGFNFIKTIYNI